MINIPDHEFVIHYGSRTTQVLSLFNNSYASKLKEHEPRREAYNFKVGIKVKCNF